MFAIRKFMPLLLAFGVLASSAAAARADSFTFAGGFNGDDNVQLFNFSLTTPGAVRLRTTSYSGGVNADSTITTAGGFDPILTIFDAAGNFLDENDDGTGTNTDPSDAFIGIFLTPGSYTLALTQYDNFAAGTSLSDGFSRAGQGNFTGVAFGSGSGSFIDFNGNQRTGGYTVNIENVGAAAAVPEPATMVLLGTGLAGLAAGIGGKKSSKEKQHAK